MAYAYGFGHGMGMGFGLGFLNFIGTILFIIAVVWAIKFLIRGFRGCAYDRGDDDGVNGSGSGGHGWGGHGWGGRGWRGPGGFGYGPRGFERHARHLRHGGRHGQDEALAVARERLARGQIGTEEFEKLRAGLERESTGAADFDAGAGDVGPRSSRRDRATEVARLRFASGEISQEEFAALKQALGG